MNSVLEIKKAVTSLSAKELSRFREWFDEYGAKVWDRQFERDARSGKLDKRANQAIAAFRAGKFKER